MRNHQKKQAGFAAPGILAIVFLAATAVGGILLSHDQDAAACEWFGTWNGAGFGNYSCLGACDSPCKISKSDIIENTYWCLCPDGGNVVNCFGGAQQSGGTVTGVTCYESVSGCNTAGHRCIPPDDSQGWNGQVGLGYRMCQCLQP